jgi:trigger factor
MQVKKTNPSETKVVITVVCDAKELIPIKNHVLTHFQSSVKLPGFREGKAPLELVEKNVNPNQFQTQFLEEAIEQLYVAAANEEKIRPIAQPQINIKKFVPYTLLEFDAEVDVLGSVKLPDYKKIKKTKPEAKVTAEDVNGVIKSLQTRMADSKDVSRAAKDGDKLWIDFKGIDAKTKEPISGADGKDYPLVIGSGTFIPGFEPKLVGMNAGEEKTFDITFPKDYGAKHLQSKKVTFTVTVTKVQEVAEPKVDDDFASKVGPFKTIAELKSDIKKQMAHEKQHKADRDFESELVKEISDKSKVVIPEVLINDQTERLLAELKQSLVGRGQTIQEFLEIEGKTEEEYRNEVLKPQAEDRVKASLVLAEIAEKEKLEVTPEELEIRMQVYKQQYQDPQMQEELNKPEARRDIAARLLTEKTVNKLVAHATGK